MSPRINVIKLDDVLVPGGGSGNVYLIGFRGEMRGEAGWPVGLLLIAVCLGSILGAGLVNFGYPWRVRRMTRLSNRRLQRAGLETAAAGTLAGTTVRGLGGDPDKTKEAVDRATVPADRQTDVLDLVKQQLRPP